MMNKEMLIEHWEYQKSLILAFGLFSDESNSILKNCQRLFQKACEVYGYEWANEHLKPISQEDNH